MTSLPCLAAAACLLGAAASATALSRPPRGPEVSYVLGRYAVAVDDTPAAMRYFEAAQRQAGGDPLLITRSFELAVAAGDLPLAATLAGRLTAEQSRDPTVALVRLADAVARRDWYAADAARDGFATAGYSAVMAPIVAAWILQGRGQGDAAASALDPARYEGFVRSYVTEHRAMLLATNGRFDAAAADYATLLAGNGAGVTRLRVAQAAAQQAAGHGDAAKQTLGGDPDVQLDAARGRLAAGRPIAALQTTPRQGIGWLAARLATDLSREKPVPLALIFARIATFLAPETGETWLITGDVLARGLRYDAALAAYAHVADSDPLARAARDRRAQVLGEAGRDDAAHALLTTAANARTATAEDWARLGDLDRKNARYVDAVRAYTRGIDMAPNPAGAGWTLYFLRGSTLEQAGDWVRAETDLRQALILSPQEPIVLNYLGYSLLDRGLKGDEAQALIETASRLRPDDGFITDSLGWAYFRTGQFERAAAVLERAVLVQPGDPAINDHLGDANWRIGRQLEARFRWRAALDLGMPAAQVALVRAKLDYGLDFALAQATH